MQAQKRVEPLLRLIESLEEKQHVFSDQECWLNSQIDRSKILSDMMTYPCTKGSREYMPCVHIAHYFYHLEYYEYCGYLLAYIHYALNLYNV
eukprot:4051956-Amphidinium_carterae.1